jgi:hypothetical protein
VKLILLALDCHWIAPVLPLSVKVVLFVPVQTVAAPLILPAIKAGLTVTKTGILTDVTDGHDTKPVGSAA